MGPTINRPFGQTYIAPPVMPSTTTSVGATTTTVAPAMVSAGTTKVSLASFTSPPATVGRESARSDKVVAAPWVSRSRPTHISIPSLGISAPLSQLGINKNKTVQVPTKWAVPGWYKYGPAPGQEGSAVILGHVDSTNGPAVFYRLATIKYGAKIVITDANGRVLHFAVIGLREYQKAKFPDKVVYGPRHYAALQLVTCGGVFDRSTGHYLANIVVFSTLVKS
ncbi:MAG: class F sortase [Acidimicrobiales bacterium]